MPAIARSYRLIRFDNGRPMRSALPFDYLDPDLPNLRLLRESEGLDALAREAADEFELIRRVQHYIKSQWDHTFHAPMQHANAVEILEDVRSGQRGNFCVYFTHVLLQALWSLGIPCRYLHVGEHHFHSHSSSECWSNTHRKWIVVDSDFDLCYLRPDPVTPVIGPIRAWVPQNAREVQQAWRGGYIAEMLPSQGEWAAGMDYAVRLGDLFGGQIGYLADYQRVLEYGTPEWAGQRCQWFVWSESGEPYPTYHRDQFSLTHGNGTITQISNPDDYYWPLNEVVVEEPALGGEVVELRFESFTPFFASFEVQVDDGPWEPLPAESIDGHRAHGRYAWTLSGPRHVLRLRSRNRTGRTGPPTWLEIAASPCVPPAPARVLDGRYAFMGGMAAHGESLYIPAGVIHVVSAKTGEARQVGTPTPWPADIHPAPAEPWNEPFNIARAADAPLGELFVPQGCAVWPDGGLVVADAENYRLHTFAADGTPLTAWGRHGTGNDEFLHLRAVAAAPDGTLYAADSGFAGPVGPRTEHHSRVRRFSRDGRLLATVAVEGRAPGQVISPAGLDLDADGGLWIADSGNHRVQCLAHNGSVRHCWGTLGDGWGELRYPTDVAVADDGVFVADPQHRCVWKFSREGAPLAKLEIGADGGVWLRPGRLVIAQGRLYVGDTTSGLVHIFTIE